MRFAYADPPYLGQGSRYGYLEWNDPERHRALIRQLVAEFPDGWAVSLSTPSLLTYGRFPETPSDVRWGAWVKPFASWKPNVNPAYAWEVVMWRGGRKRTRYEATVRDYHSENITLRRGLPGAKPPGFGGWVRGLLGAGSDDELVDLFAGTGAVAASWREAAKEADRG